MLLSTRSIAVVSALGLSFGLGAGASAQQFSRPRIVGNIDNTQRMTIPGNTRPEAIPANDLGPVDADTEFEALHLVLKRPDAAQAAFTAYVDGLSDPGSANYHHWLTNAEIGEQFGPSTADIQAVSTWLTQQGFTVRSVAPDGLTIEFAGTAGTVNKAFRTSIHSLNVNGKAHLANMTDPQIPAALAPVVAGVAKLNDFMPHSNAVQRAATRAGGARANGSAGSGYNYIGAADLATIYNFNPLFQAGITGVGQTIVLIEDTNQYSAKDFATFRSTFGLASAYPSGNLVQEQPTGTNKCTSPGTTADDGEAAIDVEWATAAAPNATIVNAACKDTSTQFGGFLALGNLLQAKTPPAIVSISYGEAEALNGATENAYINNLYSTAVAEGVSVYVSAGDEGAASADAGDSYATHGIGVSGFTSTPYNISVGGTDFGEVPLGYGSAAYFSSTNQANYRTALSYVPEIPWNDSCASNYVASALGYSSTVAACNSSTAKSDGYLTTAAGSGGPSGCATGSPKTTGEVGGSCAGYKKPAFQSLVGVPSDGVRDTPDVSLMAGNGVWGSYYAVCFSDTRNGGAACSGDPSTWAGFGGTSVASPIWAGIQALVNQKTGKKWGNSNTVLYSLANSEYGASGNSSCSATLGNQVGANCVFHDVTSGTNDVVCTGSVSCYTGGSRYGVLAVNDALSQPAYASGTGWDFASGIGTANAANVVNNWPAQ